MRDGLYKAAFRTALGGGCGVVVLNEGRVRGGDGSRYYVGAYTAAGDRLAVDLRIERHTLESSERSVFGVDQARLRAEGQGLGDEALLTGVSPDASDVAFTVVLTRLSD